MAETITHMTVTFHTRDGRDVVTKRRRVAGAKEPLTTDEQRYQVGMRAAEAFMDAMADG